jgi:hypothetical protein
MNPGWNLRLNVLRQAAEHNFLTPLRTHAWAATIESEVADGEYLLIAAERGGHRHVIAFLYTSATDNAVYKRAAIVAEYIFFSGQPYEVQSFARGVEKPVGPASDFHNLLVRWNEASAVGRFAPTAEDAEPIVVQNPKSLVLLSEEPIRAIWLRLRQLQSVNLATRLIAHRAQEDKVELAADAIRSKAEGVSYALRNATDYFHASEARTVSQRVLNLYYGSLAFAFAEMLAAPAGPKTLAEIEDVTKQGHGLYTIEGESDRLEHLVVGIIASGFFPAWMRAMHMATDIIPQRRPRVYADLQGLPALSWLTIERLFANIPEVSDLFTGIFDSTPTWVAPAADFQANVGALHFGGGPRPSRTYALLVDKTARLSKEDVAAFPGPISEIMEIAADGGGRHFRVAVDHPGKAIWWEALQVHRSPFGDAALLMPIFGAVHEYRAICVVLLYALSIIVRYRPSIWRRVQEGDLDHMRALIEAFLAVVERVLPEQFLERVTGQRIVAKQPGAF